MASKDLCRPLLYLFILVLPAVLAEGPAVTSLSYNVKSYQTLEEQNELAVITGKHRGSAINRKCPTVSRYRENSQLITYVRDNNMFIANIRNSGR